MFSWHDNLKQYICLLANSSCQHHTCSELKNGCTTQRTRWHEWFINLKKQTFDGWILQSKLSQTKPHTGKIFAHIRVGMMHSDTKTCFDSSWFQHKTNTIWLGMRGCLKSKKRQQNNNWASIQRFSFTIDWPTLSTDMHLCYKIYNPLDV